MRFRNHAALPHFFCGPRARKLGLKPTEESRLSQLVGCGSEYASWSSLRIGNVSIRWNGLRVVQPMTLITSGLSTSDTGLGVFHPCHGWPFILKEAKNC